VIDIVRAGAILDAVASDPAVEGRVRDAWEDLETFTNLDRKENDSE
jgi:hypothetical protein